MACALFDGFHLQAGWQGRQPPPEGLVERRPPDTEDQRIGRRRHYVEEGHYFKTSTTRIGQNTSSSPTCSDIQSNLSSSPFLSSCHILIFTVACNQAVYIVVLVCILLN